MYEYILCITYTVYFLNNFCTCCLISFIHLINKSFIIFLQLALRNEEYNNNGIEDNEQNTLRYQWDVISFVYIQYMHLINHQHLSSDQLPLEAELIIH